MIIMTITVMVMKIMMTISVVISWTGVFIPSISSGFRTPKAESFEAFWTILIIISWMGRSPKVMIGVQRVF